MNELIKIEQLPIITERLETRGMEIRQKIDEALSMVCTEETVKIIKVVRADLTKEFNALEDQRKQVKNAIMAPYNMFETVYKANVTDLFKPADEQLKTKIADVEDSIKAFKAAEVREYFDSYLADFPAIDFLTFERVGLNITKTANTEALKKQCAEFINKVSDDLDMIALQPDQAEILVEYIPSLNAAQAITTVAAKHKAIEAQKAAIEAQKQAYVPTPVIAPIEEKPVDDYAAPEFNLDDFEVPAFEPIFEEPNERAGKATFRIAIVDTIERIDALQETLKVMGYYFYEC